MKWNKIRGVIISFAIVASGIFVYIQSQKLDQSSDALWERYTIQSKTIDGRELRLVVADSPKKWQKGLMYVRKPVADFDGMIFIFPEATNHTFWNMNTFEDLTLYWMQDEEIMGKSELPSIEKSKKIIRVTSPEQVNIVVEVIR